jgi:5-oxoprolinase (ATP-hydrolysing)
VVGLEMTVEAVERTTITGEIFKPLDETAFRESLADLRRQKPEAIAISLLNSFANKSHEDKIREICREEFGPGSSTSWLAFSTIINRIIYRG